MRKIFQEPRFARMGRKRRRRWLKRRARKQQRVGDPHKIIGIHKKSHIVEFLAAELPYFGPPRKSGQDLIIKIPKVFSFIDNPRGAEEVLSHLVSASFAKGYRYLVIDHSECEQLDLCASVLTDLLVLELRKQWRAQKIGHRVVGFLSKSEKVNNLLRCTGLVHHLKIKGQEPAPEIDRKFVKFPLRHGYKPRGDESAKSTAQEKAADDLAKHFNECLKRFGYEFSDDGQAYIIQVAGEVIDNAERHCGRGKWWAMGYMDQNPSGGVAECELTIICLGDTIAQSLSGPDVSRRLIDDLEELAATHRKKRAFELTNKFSVQTLLTLYALQDGVSRFAYDKAGSGSGTVKMIEAFQHLGGTMDETRKPRMTVVSGASQILFDGRYKMGKVLRKGQLRSMIAFNSANNIEERPDNSCVFDYDGYFPGTVISLSFYLDARYLETIESPGP